jgi:hypothetical protein
MVIVNKAQRPSTYTRRGVVMLQNLERYLEAEIECIMRETGIQPWGEPADTNRIAREWIQRNAARFHAEWFRAEDGAGPAA